MRLIFCLVFLAITTTIADGAEQRTWTSGTFTVEAKFVKFEDGKVELDTGAKTIRISEDKLSEVDQEYIAEIRKQLAADLNWDFKSKKALAAVEKFHAANAKANTNHRLILIRALEKELRAETRAGNLKEAVEIQDAIDALKNGIEPSGGASEKKTVKIPREAVKWNGHHYLAIHRPLTAMAAHVHCQNMGGHLLRIESKEEHEFARSLARSTNETHCWIDGSDELREGEWRFSNGDKMKYLNWCPSEPYSKRDANYMTIWDKHGWRFDDMALEDNWPFLCEWDQ